METIVQLTKQETQPGFEDTAVGGLFEEPVSTLPLETMAADLSTSSFPASPRSLSRTTASGVAILTGGFDPHYTYGLATELASRQLPLEVVGGDEVDHPEMRATRNLKFLNLRSTTQNKGQARKIGELLTYYARLIRYAATARPRIFHILWNSRFQTFDRTALMLFYKLRGRKVVFTAHNVNAGKRDGKDSLLNRLTLGVQYSLCDHIFVHTELMKRELIEDFGIRESAITTIPYGINNAIPSTALTCDEARQTLGIAATEKTILFFGALRPYKGLEYLVPAFLKLAEKDCSYRLIIAGGPRKGDEKYLADVLRQIDESPCRGQVIQVIQDIPDEEVELYCKAADVAVLPYTHIFQSGVLFLAYGFGLPVVATDVGSLRDEIVEGQTGFVCRPRDSSDLARALEAYFDSDVYQKLDRRRGEIQQWVTARHSWKTVGEMTASVYEDLLAQ